MNTISELERYTEVFFKQFCNPDISIPKWNSEWNFDGTIPDCEKRGCYALLKDDLVIYIGVGIGESVGVYHGSGLGDRLKRYWKLNKMAKKAKRYSPTDEWKDVTGILTIGFTKEYYFMAAALEIYLIEKLRPIRNKIHNSK